MKLTALIVTEQWPEVLERLDSNPKEAEMWENGILPIHCACRRPKVPVPVVESLIKAYPHSLGQRSQPLGLLPLHCALESTSSTNVNVVRTLLLNYKKAAAVKDEHERMPLHFHLWSCPKPSIDVVKLLVQAHPIAVSTGDRLDRYPLHYAAKGGKLEISKFLVELFPEGLRKKSFGQAPLDFFQGNEKEHMLNALHDNQVKHIREEEEKQQLKRKAESKVLSKRDEQIHWNYEAEETSYHDEYVSIQCKEVNPSQCEELKKHSHSEKDDSLQHEEECFQCETKESLQHGEEASTQCIKKDTLQHKKEGLSPIEQESAGKGPEHIEAEETDGGKKEEDQEQRNQKEQHLLRETLKEEEQKLKKLRDELKEVGLGDEHNQLQDICLDDSVNQLQDEEIKEEKINELRDKLHGDEEELRQMRARLREEEENVFGTSYLPSTPSFKMSLQADRNNDSMKTPNVYDKPNQGVKEGTVLQNDPKHNVTEERLGILPTISPPRKKSPEEKDFTSRFLGFMTCWSPGRKMHDFD